MKKLLSALLIAIMLLSIAPMIGFDFDAVAVGATYKTGDIVEFGSYPQSKVTDSTTLSKLNAVTKKWISYGYYSGTGDYDDGQMAPSDYMKYCDITLDGNKYRAVTFSAYRPYYTGYTSSTGNTYQDDNGYYIDNVYYFKYEPLKWVVLDASTGLVICDSAIDSQAYNNYFLYSSSNDEYYGDSPKSHYASDWERSSLRTWLNNDFLNTAFTNVQQSEIKKMTRENKSEWDAKYDSKPTSDKITLLSSWDILNTSYGFGSSYNKSDTAKQRKSTDYAQCQGCYTVTSKKSAYCGNSGWWLRSPSESGYAPYVSYDGMTNSGSIVNSNSEGVVPAFNFFNISAIPSVSFKRKNIELKYKSSEALNSEIVAADGAECTVTYSSDSKNVTVDENGKIYAAKRGTANITVTVTDSQGNVVTDTCKVEVKYTWWQWLIKIVLFGWIWY